MSDRFNDAFGQLQSDIANQTPAPAIDQIARVARRRQRTRLAAAATAVVMLAGSMSWLVSSGTPMSVDPIDQPTLPVTPAPAPVETPDTTEDELHTRTPEPPSVNADGLDERCMTGRVLCIDKSANTLRWVVDGEVEYGVEVRFGCVNTPTREGAFDVYWKSRDHVSSLYDSEMPFAMFFDGGQAVHYSADFAAVGYDGCSHGAVEVRDQNGMERLFDEVDIGDAVIIYGS